MELKWHLIYILKTNKKEVIEKNFPSYEKADTWAKKHLKGEYVIRYNNLLSGIDAMTFYFGIPKSKTIKKGDKK